MKRLYSLATTFGTLPLALYSLSRSDLRGAVLRRFWPKGFPAKEIGRRRIWLHAASAGEVNLASLFAGVFADHVDPTVEFLITTNTASGVQVAQKSPVQFVRRFPFDSHPALRRLFSTFKPDCLVLVEMELWPGLIHMARERGVPVAVINARMTQASAEQYRKLNERFDGFLEIPAYFTRDDMDLQTLVKAGAPVERILVSGEMKIDLTVSEREVIAQRKQDRPMLLAASTHAGEDEIILDAFESLRDLYPETVLVLAPRHARRAAYLVRMASRRGFAVSRGSEEDLEWADVVVEGGFGHMARWYRRASIVFVGGSLVDAGGHNVLEPVLYGVPVLVGPHTSNWRHWTGFLDEHGALSEVADAADIARITGIVIEEYEDVKRAVVSTKARLLQHLGTTKRNAKLVLKMLEGGDPFALD